LPIDRVAREKYRNYGTVRDALKATHRPGEPWVRVDFNDPGAGRLTLIRHRLGHASDYCLPGSRWNCRRCTRGWPKSAFEDR